jgi:hypothetical protein
MNLLMVAPLIDSRGQVRYFIGAQVDVSGLVKDCAELEGLQRVVEQETRASEEVDNKDAKKIPEADGVESNDEFQELSEMFNSVELDMVRCRGGRLHQGHQDDDGQPMRHPRLLLKDPGQYSPEQEQRKPSHLSNRLNGRLQGIYQNVSLPDLALRSPKAKFLQHMRIVTTTTSTC